MKQIAVLVVLLALSACSLPVFFRVPVAQGNIVTPEQVGKLEKGMNKKQVEYVLGTPLIKPAFEQDRWDYVFYYRNPRAHVRHSKLNLYFTNGQLSDIEGNEEYAAQVARIDRQSSTDDSAGASDQAGASNPSLSSLNNAEQQRSKRRQEDAGRRNGQAQRRDRNPAGREPTPSGNDRRLPNTQAPLPGNPANEP